MKDIKEKYEILVVDDTPANLNLFSSLLSQNGYKVRLMPNGPLALKSIEAAPPDLILLDIKMPEMNGFEVCRLLKQNEQYKEIPVLFISALDDVRDKVKAFEAGGLDYVTKPFREEEVLARIRTHLELRTYQQEIKVAYTGLNEKNVQLKKINKTLGEEKKRFLDIVSSTGDWIWEVDEEGRFTYSNLVVKQVLGYEPEEIIDNLFYDFIQPDSKEEMKKTISEVFSQKEIIKDYYNQSIKKDGSMVILEITGIPIIDEEGLLCGYRGASRDVTERRKAKEALENAYKELKEAQNRLIQSEKMAGIGQLAAGIAHEINNPNGFIMSNLLTLQKNIRKLFFVISSFEDFIVRILSYVPERSKDLLEVFNEIKKNSNLDYYKRDLPELVDDCLDGCNRIKIIVANLKDFTHPASEGYISSDLNKDIDKALSLIHNELKYNCRILKEYDDLPKINVNPQQIQQVILNLLINASHAIEGEGIIHIKTFCENGYVCIVISDNGEGISQEIIEKIFEPFFTTKEIGKGTGLGLSIVHGIINEHNGKIDVQSEIGKGTTFTIKLPR